MRQEYVVCHGGLFDGRRIAVDQGRWPRESIEFIVPEKPRPVTEAISVAPSSIILVTARYVLARTLGGRAEFVYVPDDFYVERGD